MEEIDVKNIDLSIVKTEDLDTSEKNPTNNDNVVSSTSNTTNCESLPKSDWQMTFTCAFCSKKCVDENQLRNHTKWNHPNLVEKCDQLTKPCFILLNKISDMNNRCMPSTQSDWVRINEEYIQKLDFKFKNCITGKCVHNEDGYSSAANIMNYEINEPNLFSPSVSTSGVKLEIDIKTEESTLMETEDDSIEITENIPFVKSEDDDINELSTSTYNQAQANDKLIEIPPKVWLSKVKRKRQRILLKQKIQILDRLKSGEKFCKISKELNISSSTIRGIQIMEDKIRKRISIGSSASIYQTARVKNNLLARTENCLMIWIEDCRQKNVPLDGQLIKTKAIKVFEHLKEKEINSEEKFVASKGWFEGLKKRFSLNYKNGECSTADKEAADIFVNTFKTIIEAEGYTADQVFNADEKSLYWKKMPDRTYVSKTEKSASGLSISKDKISLILCSNASGDCVTKPMVINPFLKPRSMKGVNVEDLPVYWRGSRKALVTRDIFKDWFYNCFVPEVQNYAFRKNIAFKILLIIDNAPGHPTDLHHPNVNIVFIPPNTTSLIQPLDQGITKAFKSYYIRQTFQFIVDKLKSNPNITLLEVWKEFSILNCVEIVDTCIKELKSSSLNACWRCIWPDVVLKESNPISSINENDRIINIARALGGEGFDDMNENDINELLIDDVELDEDDLKYLAVKTIPKNNNSIISEESKKLCLNDPKEGLNLERLNKGLQMFKDLETYFTKYDGSTKRTDELKKQLEKCKAPYYKIREEIQNISKDIIDIDENILIIKKEPNEHVVSNASLECDIKSTII